MLQQPDSEFFDLSKKPLEKYLIKWMHSSYLHVSWETEKDLHDLVGNIGKVRGVAVTVLFSLFTLKFKFFEFSP